MEIKILIGVNYQRKSYVGNVYLSVSQFPFQLQGIRIDSYQLAVLIRHSISVSINSAKSGGAPETLDESYTIININNSLSRELLMFIYKKGTYNSNATFQFKFESKFVSFVEQFPRGARSFSFDIDVNPRRKSRLNLVFLR